MSNVIDKGTIACVPGTLSGDVYAVFSSYYTAPELAVIGTLLKRVAYSVAAGWHDNVIASIDDTKYLQINAGAIVGGAGGSGPPPAHAASHENGGSDEVNVAGLSGLLADGQTPLAHAASHENGGADELSVAGLSGVLADPQTPAAHAASHASGGGDAIKLDDLAAPDDNTDLNSSVTAHGLLRKLDGLTTTYLRGDGAWATPAVAAHASTHENGGGDELNVAGLSGLLADGQTPLAHAASHVSGGLDSIKIDDLAPGDDNTDLNASLAAHGLLRKLTGSTTDYLRADGTWAAVAGGSGLSHAEVMARSWYY